MMEVYGFAAIANLSEYTMVTCMSVPADGFEYCNMQEIARITCKVEHATAYK